MAIEQTDSDRLSGIIRLRFGSGAASKEFEVPALPLRPAQQWVDKLLAGFDGVIGRAAEQIRDDAGVSFLNVPFLVSRITMETAIDLVVAYDRAAALDREWLEENATPRQMHSALEVMHEEALPFDDAARKVGTLLIQAAIQSLAQSSTSSPSTSGTSNPPVPLNRATRRASSRSSGKQARSA